jgi:hypothetical protein
MSRQEEECPISVRSDDNSCTRLAEPNLPMVPGQRIVRPTSRSALGSTPTDDRRAPHAHRPPNKPYTTHRLLLGTHTSGQAADYLQIATVQIPSRAGPGADVLDRSTYDDERGELGGHTLPASQARINVVQRINHAGEVNRARYMPQNPDMIATKAVSGEVLVFDRTKHPSEPERGGVCKPDIRLVGQTREGLVLRLHCYPYRCRLDALTRDIEGSGWHGIRIRRATYSARRRTRRCAIGKDPYPELLLCRADGLTPLSGISMPTQKQIHR